MDSVMQEAFKKEKSPILSGGGILKTIIMADWPLLYIPVGRIGICGRFFLYCLKSTGKSVRIKLYW